MQKRKTIAKNAKKGQKQKTQNQQKDKAKRTGFGRPENSGLEIKFMGLIRDSKLQATYAETQLEMELFDGSATDCEGQFSIKSCIKDKILSFFMNRDVHRFAKLSKDFELAVKNWKFVEITNEKEFKEVLFEDAYDLSYIYDFLERDQKNKELKTRSLCGDELLFCELMCLNERRTISEKAISSILRADVVNEMAYHLDRIKNRDPQNEDQSQNNANEQKLSLEEVEEHHQERQQISIDELYHQVSKKEESQSKEAIQGPEIKGTRKRRQLNLIKEEKKSDEKDLVPIFEKMLTHILFAYLYVRPA